jgi:predicted transcriptional regulator
MASEFELSGVQRKGVLVRDEDGMTHAVLCRDLEEDVRHGDTVKWTMETGPFTADREYEGEVIGMVLDARTAEKEDHDLY